MNFCARAAVSLGAGATLQLNGHAITAAGVVCSGNGNCAVSGPGTVASAPVGILGRKKVVASGLTLDGGTFGIVTRRGGAILTNVNLTDNLRDGIWSWRGAVKAAGVVATGNGSEGIYATLKPVIVRDTTASNNGGNGIDGNPARGVRVTAQANGGAGMISAKAVTAVDSTITGNALAIGGIDIHSPRRPRVRNTVCDHSYDSGPGGGGSFGICALD